MNVYLINEDGEHFCIRAESMYDAIMVCEKDYLEERQEDETEEYDEKAEKDFYHKQILQSCSFVGELKN